MTFDFLFLFTHLPVSADSLSVCLRFPIGTISLKVVPFITGFAVFVIGRICVSFGTMCIAAEKAVFFHYTLFLLGFVYLHYVYFYYPHTLTEDRRLLSRSINDYTPF